MVYGTLKRGFHNHLLLETSDFLGEVQTPGKLYVRGLPYYKKAHEGTWVYGELYRIDDTTLSRLDRLEGYRESNPALSFYNRITVAVCNADGTGDSIDAYIYEYNGNVSPHDLNTEGVYHG
jgi:gamma-glutamylaminecyclotransferase